MNQFSADHLSDKELLDAASRYAATNREATAALVAALAVIEVRSLHLAGGYDSIYSYCREALRLSEHAAYLRIDAARASRKYPVILELLASGALTLTTVRLLHPVLTRDNHGCLLANACYRSKREVEEQLAALRPAPPPPIVIKPSAPGQYVLQFTVGQATHDRLRLAQDLLRHQVPDGDLPTIFDKALALLVAVTERRKWAATGKPRAGSSQTEWSRHVPAAVRRAAWKRDGGQCAFVGTDGRCSCRAGLEFHHVDPFAVGGEATIENIQLRCRAHNVYEAELFFGTAWVAPEGSSAELGPDRVDPGKGVESRAESSPAGEVGGGEPVRLAEGPVEFGPGPDRVAGAEETRSDRIHEGNAALAGEELRDALKALVETTRSKKDDVPVDST